jgi:hypothetical protein
MPAWVLASPQVVMLRMPETKVAGSLGIGGGPQRSWAMGRSWSSGEGAVFQPGISVLAKRPVWRTDGRMR